MTETPKPTYWQARQSIAKFLTQWTRPEAPKDTIMTVQTMGQDDATELREADLVAVLNGPPRRTDPDRTAHWGTCPNDHSILIYPHPDAAEDLPPEEDWEDSFMDCPVCDERIDFGGTDHPADLLRNY